MKNCFCETVVIDDERCVSVSMLPDGAFKIEGLTVREHSLDARYRGERIVFSREAMVALKEILNGCEHLE